MHKIEIDITREWLMMMQDYCVKAEFGQDLPPEGVKAMHEFLGVRSVKVNEAEENAKQHA